MAAWAATLLRIRQDRHRLARRRRRLEQALARLDKAVAVSATRDRGAERRARTRHLIELGGLVVKAGLVNLAADDRATLLGLLLRDAERLRDGDEEGGPAELRARARRRGLKAFDDDAADAVPGNREEVERLSAPAD